MTPAEWWRQRWCDPCWRRDCAGCDDTRWCEHPCPWLTRPTNEGHPL